MSKVFVLDTNKHPLHPVHPARARMLLDSGKAAIFKRYPFTIILKVAIDCPVVDELRVKLDPGSRTTGITILNDATGEVVFAAELAHRGHKIKERLESRRAIRRSRRHRKTRYRKARWHNRRRKQNWLPPSLQSRISNVLTWVQRLMRLCPIRHISLELVKFDMQAMDTPEIAGVEYQQGALAGYEAREYLLEKWNRACAYCDQHSIPLQVEHIVPRAKGGTNRVSNLCLACERCNLAKGTQNIQDFLKKQPDRLKRILAQTKAPLRDAAVNATRWELFRRLQSFGLPIECGTGGRTKYNRSMRALPKTHWLDAACVGASTPEHIRTSDVVPIFITATGHGNRQMCRMDRFGFPRTGPKQRRKRVQGFQTGDIVKAVVTSGTKQGTYVGKVSIRRRGSFNITTAQGVVTDVHYRFCARIAHCALRWLHLSCERRSGTSSLSLKA